MENMMQFAKMEHKYGKGVANAPPKVQTKHAQLRESVKLMNVQDGILSKQTFLFQSMCKTIMSDVHRDAMFNICIRFRIAVPFVNRIFDRFLNEVKLAQSGNIPAPVVLVDSNWSDSLNKRVSLIKVSPRCDDDVVVKCIQEMCDDEIHVLATRQVCQEIGLPAQSLVDFVLYFYSRKLKCTFTPCTFEAAHMIDIPHKMS